LIKELNRTRGITSVVVTHDLAAALKYADRIMLLENGKAVECSASKEFEKAENPSVRKFLAATKGEEL
jgi:ABC-type transporter Mla maintaining outer membrane lipid asymmetry ATPase subunit MlaF